jgi:uncharacterized protein (DUF2342 family)
MSYKFHWAENNVHVIFKGDIDFDEIVEVANTIIGSPKFDLMKYAIFDYLNVNKYDLKIDDIEAIASLNKHASLWNEKIRLALVDNEVYITKMLKEYIKMMNGVKWQIKRFDTLEESLIWCNDNTATLDNL